MNRFFATLCLGSICYASVLMAGCGQEPPQEPTPWQWDLPEGFPTPNVPDDNPMTVEKVELGRHLFYERRLSFDESTSCASCHRPEKAFSDGRTLPVGATGDEHPRNAMSLTDVAYNSTFNWANPVVESLEQQALTPMFGDDPVEMGLHKIEETWLARLEDNDHYPTLFAAAFPGHEDPFSLENVLAALASFERTLISGNSDFDRFVYQGDDDAMSEEAQRGMSLFFSERLECFHCHGGFNFTDDIDHEGMTISSSSFHNTGLYNYDHRGSYPPGNQGLYEFTQEPRDMGRFRAPTLRNIEYTAPYMHDGSIETLDEVIDHYAAGGRRLNDGEWAGDGSQNPFKSEFITGFQISEEERRDLLEFLKSLSDDDFIEDPAYSDPFDDE